MKNDKDYLLELAYTYYPKGISEENADVYHSTPEFQKLTQSLQERKHLDIQWKKLLSVLHFRFDCLDIGFQDPLLRGYRIAIVLTFPRRHYIVVNVSKLIPYYCFYTNSDRDDLHFLDPGFFIFSNFIPSDQEVVNWVSNQIKFHFEGYEELSSNLPLVPIEDVVFDERGILLSNIHLRHFDSMTLFNAFFSTNMFTD